MKKILLKLTPKKVNRIFVDDYKRIENSKNSYTNVSFSQEGEDLVLDRFLNNKSKGFFIDVGAHHPKRISNTYKYNLRTLIIKHKQKWTKKSFLL